uniref:Putative secreted protein n=1 Tax=Anopheles darlingi TaxID=43151 RepID=A0A2M4DK40_ANODA
MCAVIIVIVAAVHWPMAKRNNPRSQPTVLWSIGFLEIATQPLILIDQRLQTIVHEIIYFGRKPDKVNRSQIEAVHHILRPSWHAKTGTVVGEIVFLLVIASTNHVRCVGGDRLNLVHELIAHPGILRIHIIRKVSDVYDRIIHVALCVLLQPSHRLGILVAHITEDGEGG